MKVYKSLSPKHVEQPYIFKVSSQKIYSFEGLVLYCFKHWMEAVEVFESEAIGYFLCDVLKLTKWHQVWFNLVNESIAPSAKLLQFLRLTPYFNEEQIEALSMEIEKWEAQPLHTQYKKLGDQAFNDKKYLKAINLYKQAQDINFDPVVEHNIGIGYLKLYFFNEAEEAFLKASQCTDLLEVHLGYIRLLRITNRESDALTKVKTLLESYKDVELYIEYGLIYEKMKAYPQAYDAFKKAYELEVNENIKLKLIELCYKVDPAHPFLKTLGELPKNEAYYLLKASFLIKEDRLEEAIELLEEAVITVKKQENLYMTLSKLYRQKKQLIKAIGAITEAAKHSESNDEILFEMALIAKRAGNWVDYETKIDELITLWKNDVRRRFSE